MCQLCTYMDIDHQQDKPQDERKSIKIQTDYMKEAFGDIQLIADRMGEQIPSDSYDTIVGTGLSGALVIPRLAELLGKKWAIVRKKDGTHSNSRIEGEIGRNWLFVDDGIDSGHTRRRVKLVIANTTYDWDFETKYTGTYQYHYNRYTSDVGEWS